LASVRSTGRRLTSVRYVHIHIYQHYRNVDENSDSFSLINILHWYCDCTPPAIFIGDIEESSARLYFGSSMLDVDLSFRVIRTLLGSKGGVIV